MQIKRVSQLTGELTVPGDKSISHRAIMLGAIANGTTEISNFLNGADCLSTMACFQQLGIEIDSIEATHIRIRGKGLHGLKKPDRILDVGNSGTTMRLLSGILAGQTFDTMLTGDASIQQRPMKRIFDPLTEMGALLQSRERDGFAPYKIYGRKLQGIRFTSPVASAQIKSCILLAGLYAAGMTRVTEPSLSRNHTELMLKAFGADLYTKNTQSVLTPGNTLSGQQLCIPGDISSAAYFLAAALITPNSELLLKDTGINPTRAGILKIARAMGADITLLNERSVSGEPMADILVKTSQLRGIPVGGDQIPALIDEIPVLAVMACFAEGETVISDAAELKVKESNRIDSVVTNLRNMGAAIEATEDGMIIRGGRPLKGCMVKTKNDHRIAMAFTVAGLNADGYTELDDSRCVNISYPGFFRELMSLSR